MIPPELAAPHDTEPVIALAEVQPPPSSENRGLDGDSLGELVSWLMVREGLTYPEAWHRVYSHMLHSRG